MTALLELLKTEITWYKSLEKAEFLGVTAFLFCTAFFIICLIALIVYFIKKLSSPMIKLDLTFENVTLESFRKKSFVTFDLYIHNKDNRTLTVNRVGFIMADGTEKTFYQEQHILKTANKITINPGEELFYNDCDLFYCLNDKQPYYKIIIGLFVDVNKHQHCTFSSVDIPAVLNDQAIRTVLTDRKGVNGF